MEYIFDVNMRKLVKKIVGFDKEFDSNEEEIREIIEVASNVDRSIDAGDEFINRLDLKNIEAAILRLEEYEEHKSFWDELIDLEYIKDNIKLIDEVNYGDVDEEWF